MTNDIVPGFDCCNDYRYPLRTPRIYPRHWITLETGGNVNLYLKTVHPSCYESCFTWRITYGGGWLDPEFGIETYYHAPYENEGCQQSATVECRCPRELLDVVYIGVNQYMKPEWACITAGRWHDGASGLRTTCTGWVPIYPWEPFMTDKFSCIRVARRNCDGSARNYDAITVMAMRRKDPKKGWVTETDRFYCNTGILTKETYGKIVSGSFAECKQGALNQRMAMWLGAWQIVQDPRPSYDAAYKLIRSGALLKPGGAVDVRTAKMIEQGCCPRHLMPKE